MNVERQSLRLRRPAFDRLSWSGVFEIFFDHFPASPHPIVAIATQLD